MTHLKLAATTGLLLLATTIPAFAADMPDLPDEPLPPPLVEQPAPSKGFGDGWYLRGDIGYVMSDGDLESNARVPYLSTSRDGACGSPCAIWESTETSLVDVDREDTWSAGLGIGYDFGWIRTDLTADYTFKSKTSGSRVDPNNFAPADGIYAERTGDYHCEGDGWCKAEESGKVSKLTLLVNAYADLGEYYGLTPYVGAGIGASYVTWSDWKTDQVCGGTNLSCTPDHPDFGWEYKFDHISWDHDDTSQWAFAWALMAGASYKISDNLDLDVGYRYLQIEDGAVEAEYRYVNGDKIGTLKFKDDASHEVRAGLRYTLPALW
jgi:opacity protein-like surface antigen